MLALVIAVQSESVTGRGELWKPRNVFPALQRSSIPCVVFVSGCSVRVVCVTSQFKNMVFFFPSFASSAPTLATLQHANPAWLPFLRSTIAH